MDISYWIIILVVYLLYQWMRRRVRRFGARPPEEGAAAQPRDEIETSEEGLPAWLRELGLKDLKEEQADEPGVKAPETEPGVVRRLRETIEAIEVRTSYGEPTVEAEGPAAPEAPPVPSARDIADETDERTLKEVLSERGKFRSMRPEGKATPSSRTRVGNLIYDPDSLRNLMVLREILGPPRATRPHRPPDRS